MPIRGFAKSQSSKQPGFSSAPSIIELGGINEDENPQSLRPFDLRIGSNCARKGGTLGTRPGVKYGDTDYAAALAGTPGIQGLYEFIRNKDADRDVVVVADGAVYKNNVDAALGKGGATITTGDNNLWTFAVFQDKLFAAGGALNDDFWYWDGTGAGSGVIAPIALGLNVEFVFSKWNMLFVCGMDGTTFDDNALVYRYCDFATDATDPLNWKSSNSIPGQLLGENFGVDARGDEYATGFGSYTDNRGDFLIALTNKRIVSFGINPTLTSNADAFIVVDTVPTGCVNQNAFVSLGLDSGEAIYMSRDGVHSLAQSQQYGNKVGQYLSWPIRNTFKTLNPNRFDNVSAAYWRNEGMVLFSVSTGSETVNNLILCLDIRGADVISQETVRWYKWELNGITCNRIVPMRGSDGKPYPYVGGIAGEVVRFDRDSYSDLTTGAISTTIQTKDEDFGIPGREKHIGDLYVSMQGLGGATVQHSFMLDDGGKTGQTSLLDVPNTGSLWGTGVWGTAVWGTQNTVKRHRVPGVGSSPTLGHRFTHTGANKAFWVGLINQELMISGPSDDSNANVIES